MLKTFANESTFFDDFLFHNFIPKDHKLVKIKGFLNLDFILPLVKSSYKNKYFSGNDSYDPRTLFMACLLGFLENLSDVKLAEKIFEIPLYRFFVGLSPQDKTPDDTTISFFRVNRMREENFKIAFDQVVKQLFDAGLIDGKIQSQDATHTKGNIAILNPLQLLNTCRNKILNLTGKLDPSLYKVWERKYAFKLDYNPKSKQKHFEELITLCQKLYKDALKQRKLLKNKKFNREVFLLEQAISERQDEYFDDQGLKQQKEAEEKIKRKMINPSDPEVNWGAKSDKKFFAGYKIMSNLDHKYGIITSITAQKAGDAEEKYASWLIEQQKNNLGLVPEHFTADAKYDYGDTRLELKAAGVENLYIPLVPTKNKEDKYSLDNFYLENGNLVCPAGHMAEHWHGDDNKMAFEFRFNADICNHCKLKKDCTASKCSGRKVLVASSQMERRIALSFNTTEEYAFMMRNERYKIEPRQADMKRYHGLDRAKYKGLSRMRIQTYLTAIASNLKKWFKYSIGKLKDGSIRTLSILAAMAPPPGEVCLNTV